MPDSWKSMFYHSQHEAMLMVYVDDFQLACPSGKEDAIWKEIAGDAWERFELVESMRRTTSFIPDEIMYNHSWMVASEWGCSQGREVLRELEAAL